MNREIVNKYIIYLDENVLVLKDELTKLGYKINVFLSGMKDIEIHNILNQIREKTKKKPIIFITKDYDDFLSFSNRKYYILGIASKKTKDKLSKIIQNFLSSESLLDGSIFKITD